MAGKAQEVEVHFLLNHSLRLEDPDIVGATAAAVLRSAKKPESNDILDHTEAVCEYNELFKSVCNELETALGVCDTSLATTVNNGATSKRKYYECSSGSSANLSDLHQWYSCNRGTTCTSGAAHLGPIPAIVHTVGDYIGGLNGRSLRFQSQVERTLCIPNINGMDATPVSYTSALGVSLSAPRQNYH